MKEGSVGTIKKSADAETCDGVHKRSLCLSFGVLISIISCMNLIISISFQSWAIRQEIVIMNVEVNDEHENIMVRLNRPNYFFHSDSEIISEYSPIEVPSLVPTEKIGSANFFINDTLVKPTTKLKEKKNLNSTENILSNRKSRSIIVTKLKNNTSILNITSTWDSLYSTQVGKSGDRVPSEGNNRRRSKRSDIRAQTVLIRFTINLWRVCTSTAASAPLTEGQLLWRVCTSTAASAPLTEGQFLWRVCTSTAASAPLTECQLLWRVCTSTAADAPLTEGQLLCTLHCK